MQYLSEHQKCLEWNEQDKYSQEMLEITSSLFENGKYSYSFTVNLNEYP